jgi:hypothetical protein
MNGEAHKEIKSPCHTGNAAIMDRPLLARGPLPPQRNIGAPGGRAFWRNAAQPLTERRTLAAAVPAGTVL